MRSDAWLGLSDIERHDVRRNIEAEAATRASRAASDAARGFSEMQRNEKLAFMLNGDRFLHDTSPDVLTSMSRAQVEAKRGLYGMEATKHLLDKWDTLQKPSKLTEARMDTEDFNIVADKLGLQPFNQNKGEEHKRALGTLKYRVEQLIDVQQRQAGKPLDRQSKMDLMRQEMAKTVVVNPGMFSFNKEVPVIQLTADQLKDVVIPATERVKIAEALRMAHDRDPTNPLFAPTDENMRRAYVRAKSIAGKLIE